MSEVTPERKHTVRGLTDLCCHLAGKSTYYLPIIEQKDNYLFYRFILIA